MLFLTSTLTHLGAASVKLSITAQDGEGLTSVRTAEVTINVLHSAQAPAVFQRSRYTFAVPEDAPPGTSVGTVEAINPAGECLSGHVCWSESSWMRQQMGVRVIRLLSTFFKVSERVRICVFFAGGDD